MKKLFFATLFMLLLAVSVAAAPPAQAPAGEEYVVQANDWLSKLALKYYGDMFAFDKIVAATNAKAAEDDTFAAIDNPDVIEVGQKLWIPAAEVGGAAGVLTVDMLKNAQYVGIYDTAIQLSDGHYEGKPFVEGGASRPTVDFIDDFYAFGDLNGDGIKDAVVFLAENSGGSGVFTYAATVLNKNGAPVNADTAFLGDRGELISVTIEDGVIAVDMVTQGPDDPLCCPTLEVVKSFSLEADGGLVELPEKEIGTISTAALDGKTWVLVGFDNPMKPTPALADPPATLVVDATAGKISGSGGCNNYFADFTEESPRKLSVGPIGATGKMCAEDVMAQEQKFLSALQSLRGFQFWNGQLLLNTGDGLVILAPQK